MLLSTSLVKMLSIIVALWSVILVGLSINGYSPKLNIMSTQFFVGVLSLYFRRSMLRSPHTNFDFFTFFLHFLSLFLFDQ